MKQTYPDKIRAAFKKISQFGDPVTTTKLALALDLIEGDDKRPFHAALKDMVKTGEVARISKGIVSYKGRGDKDPDIRSAMWTVIRMRKSVTIADLQELANASEHYAREFLQLLVRRGSVEHIRKKNLPSVYRLISDLGPDTPLDTEKAEKLKRIREAKKRALKKLDEAGEMILAATHAVVHARIAINDISEE